MDDAEAQMRRALGALGLAGGNRARPDMDRSDTQMPSRPSDRFNPNHRRRFVQDGDVPVTVVRRGETGGDPASRQAAVQASPLAGRLQRAETALAAETAARQQAERGYQEAQAIIRDLRTKLGHADLARNEAVEAVRRERESLAAQRAALQEQAARQQEAEERAKSLQRELLAVQVELADLRAERKTLEKSLRAAEEARETAERLVRVLSEEDAETSTITTLASRRSSAGTRGKKAAASVEAEPEPVKWWLNAPVAKRR